MSAQKPMASHDVLSKTQEPLTTHPADRSVPVSQKERQVEIMVRDLETRIKTLEDQNNQLIYFMYFLYENFPELVRKILPQNILLGLAMKKTEEQIHREIQEAQPVTQPQPTFHHPVTTREKEVLVLLAKGLCAKEIAQQLFISEATVVTHKKNLKDKFEARNTAELISKSQQILKELTL